MKIERKAQLPEPQAKVSCSDWLEEHRDEYESCKDLRFINEPDPDRPGWTRTSVLYPDDPRYLEGSAPLFAQNYQRCVQLLEQCTELVEDMKLCRY